MRSVQASSSTQEVPRLRPQICTALERAPFPGVLGQPPARVRAATRRAVATASPRRTPTRSPNKPGRAGAQRFVCVRPSLDPEMTEWVAQQPTQTSAAAWAAVDHLAHAYVADGEHARWNRPAPTP